MHATCVGAASNKSTVKKVAITNLPLVRKQFLTNPFTYLFRRFTFTFLFATPQTAFGFQAVSSHHIQPCENGKQTTTMPTKGEISEWINKVYLHEKKNTEGTNRNE